jgi:hypothetical protein
MGLLLFQQKITVVVQLELREGQELATKVARIARPR